jgi:trigger factor
VQSAVETLNDLELKINISVPANELKVAYGNKVKEVAKKAKVDGFRVGKVPEAYIKQIYGKSIENEVVDELVRVSFNKVCQENAITVAGIDNVDVTQKELGKDLEFSINVETFPQIKFEENDFSNISVEKFEVEVTDADVVDAIEKLRKSHATWESVKDDAAAKMGDKVVVDFTAEQDGENLEAGAATDFDLELGSKHLIPGFEEGIVGHKINDEFLLELEFPQDYHASEQAGKHVKFTVTLKDIQAPVLPELNDEFYAKFGITDAKEEEHDHEHSENCTHEHHASDSDAPKDLAVLFKERVKHSLEQEAKSNIANKYNNAIFDGLRNHKELKVPKTLVEEEITNLINQQQERYRKYVGNKNAKLDLNRESFKAQAEKNAHLRLLVRAFIEQYDIKADRTAVKAKLSEAMGGHEISEDLLNWYYSEPNRLGQLEAMVIEDIVVTKIAEKIKITNKKVNFSDLTVTN